MMRDIGNKTVGPVLFDTNLYAETYLNMLQDTIMPSLLKEQEKSAADFLKDGTTYLWYLRATMVDSIVSGFLDWYPWSRGLVSDVPSSKSV
jgi:hypothetical protein